MKRILTVLSMCFFLGAVPVHAGTCMWGYLYTQDAIDDHDLVVEGKIVKPSGRLTLPKGANFWELDKWERTDAFTLKILKRLKGTASGEVVVEHPSSFMAGMIGGHHTTSSFKKGVQGIFFLDQYDNTISIGGCTPIVSSHDFEMWKLEEKNNPKWSDCDTNLDGQCNMADIFSDSVEEHSLSSAKP